MTTNWTPETKIGSAAVVSALGTLITAIASHKGYTISPEAAAAIVGFAGVAIGYLVPNQWKRLEPIQEDIDPELLVKYRDRLDSAIDEINLGTSEHYLALAQIAEVLMIEAREHASHDYELEEIS